MRRAWGQLAARTAVKVVSLVAVSRRGLSVLPSLQLTKW